VQHLIDKARILIEALPYIREFRGRTFVIKVGGAALEDLALRERLAEDLILLDWVGINLVLVHGGGKQVTDMLQRLGIESQFSGGLRVTDEATLQIVEMVLGGSINKEIVRLINHLGGAAVGLTGKDGGMIKARPYRDDLGLVGEVIRVDRAVIDHLIDDYIPVVAPLAVGANGETLNINADPFAACIAVALEAEKLVLLTDVEGVQDADGTLISSLQARHAERMIEAGTIAGGMIPKVENALQALEQGVQKVHIIDGRLEHALLLEIFTKEGVGTEVVGEDTHEQG
jgi:acetylglutamate kinase